MKPLVFLVEDDDVLVKNFKLFLEMNDYDLVTAYNGKNALEVLSNLKNPPDIIISDILMPIMDGYEATKKIKQIRPKLPVIAQTAYSTDEDIQKAIEAGCDDFISKPIDRNLLKPLLSRYIFKTT